ncbi:hypothetical protein V495_08112, partial [Pseudogymnoascus sp. VKM F-4514 (FW-929)]
FGLLVRFDGSFLCLDGGREGGAGESGNVAGILLVRKVKLGQRDAWIPHTLPVGRRDADELSDKRCPIGGDIWCGGINAVPIKTAVMRAPDLAYVFRPAVTSMPVHQLKPRYGMKTDSPCGIIITAN